MIEKHYKGNPNLKAENVNIEFTTDQIQEYLKCKNDPIYFAKNYVKIVSLDHGLMPFEMYDFQEELITNFHQNRFNIAKLPRQTGKSTTVVSYLLHYALFNDNIRIAILANKAETARELLGRLQLSYENLPKWLQQGVGSWNKGSLEIENGSKIVAASTSSSMFGNSINTNVPLFNQPSQVSSNISGPFSTSFGQQQGGFNLNTNTSSASLGIIPTSNSFNTQQQPTFGVI